QARHGRSRGGWLSSRARNGSSRTYYVGGHARSWAKAGASAATAETTACRPEHEREVISIALSLCCSKEASYLVALRGSRGWVGGRQWGERIVAARDAPDVTLAAPRPARALRRGITLDDRPCAGSLSCWGRSSRSRSPLAGEHQPAKRTLGD